jgi:cytochrome P450
VDRVSAGGEIGRGAGGVRGARDATSRARSIEVRASCRRDRDADHGEVVSNAAVMMFGGIETSEGMTTSLFWHLLSSPGALDEVQADRALLTNAIDESLRLEPAAGGWTATRRETSTSMARASAAVIS